MNPQLTGDLLLQMLQAGYARSCCEVWFLCSQASSGNGNAGLLQGFKPVLIQALVPEGAVKALDVSVLRWAA